MFYIKLKIVLFFKIVFWLINSVIVFFKVYYLYFVEFVSVIKINIRKDFKIY